mgnify:CR=1 FL=1|jgi:hypothetical protein
MEKKIKQVLINNMELFDEGTGLMGIPDDDTKLEIIAQEIVKLLTIPPVSNSVCTCGSSNYGYGFAKCYDCGKIKDF